MLIHKYLSKALPLLSLVLAAEVGKVAHELLLSIQDYEIADAIIQTLQTGEYEKLEVKGRGTIFVIKNPVECGRTLSDFHQAFGTHLVAENKLWIITGIEMFIPGTDLAIGESIGLLVRFIRDLDVQPVTLKSSDPNFPHINDDNVCDFFQPGQFCLSPQIQNNPIPHPHNCPDCRCEQTQPRYFQPFRPLPDDIADLHSKQDAAIADAYDALCRKFSEMYPSLAELSTPGEIKAFVMFMAKCREDWQREIEDQFGLFSPKNKEQV